MDTNTFDIPNYSSYGFVQMAQSINAIDAPITYLADLFKSANIYAEDENGNIVENDPLALRLQEPNHLQGAEEFLAEFYYYLCASGWAYMLPYSKSVGFEKDLSQNELFALNPDFCTFGKIKQNIFELDRLSFKYKYGNSETSKELFTDNVIPFYDGAINAFNPFIGHSRLESIRDEAINTILADKGKFNQIKRSGGMVISHKEKGTDGFSEGLDEEYSRTRAKDGSVKIKTHKEEIDEKLNSVGLAQGKSIVVSSKELTGFSMAKDIIGIDFSKMKESDIVVISNKIGVPPELMPLNGNNATYENRESAQYQVLQNRIIPVANNVATALTKYFNRPNKLVFSYEHLPAYQFAKREKEESKNKIVERVEKLYQMGILSREQVIQTLTNNDVL